MIKLESSLPKDTLYQVWLKLVQWFRRRWKCEKFTDRRTDKQTTDERWSEKLTWAFSSGELKNLTGVHMLVVMLSSIPGIAHHFRASQVSESLTLIKVSEVVCTQICFFLDRIFYDSNDSCPLTILTFFKLQFLVLIHFKIHAKRWNTCSYCYLHELLLNIQVHACICKLKKFGFLKILINAKTHAGENSIYSDGVYLLHGE